MNNDFGKDVSLLTNEEIAKIYDAEFPLGMSANDVNAKLKTMENREEINSLRKMFCNMLLYDISEGFVSYGDKVEFAEDGLVKIFIENVKLIPEEIYYQAVAAYFNHQNDKCLDLFKKDMQLFFKDIPEKLSEGDIVELYVAPIKKGFDGFWDAIANNLRQYPHEDGIPELCEMLGKFYASTNDNEAIEILSAFIQKYPQFITPRELLGFTYQSLKMWNNSIACFEYVEGRSMFFFDHIVSWFMAWAYGKVKEYKKEEAYYRKVLELTPKFEFANNNLGYCLYKQKKYNEAKEIFESCLERKIDLPYAANNYVRVLIALGRNQDAKQFVKETDHKISKSLVDKVKSLDNSNARIKKDIVEEIAEDAEDSVKETKIDLGIKKQQFSDEKLLEDELTARIERGVPVFGLNLKIYKRKGEYGRQYIIPVGRLDLLCEDDDNNLYIIELKKDSGYDDAYKQTADYLDWFEKNWKQGHKSIQGIICLNNPTKKLLDKVHNDPRMRVFEYQISYTEM